MRRLPDRPRKALTREQRKHVAEVEQIIADAYADTQFNTLEQVRLRKASQERRRMAREGH